MTKKGKISVIVKQYGIADMKTLQSELAKNNMTRVPGTGVFKYPYKELDGAYRTGLDVKAAYIQRIPSKEERDLEIERIEEDLKFIQDRMGDVDLGPRSKFWNAGLARDSNSENHVKPAKLIDGDNHYDLSLAQGRLMFAWLRVHPTIASSLEAYNAGEYPSETQWYVADESRENAIEFKKKRKINQAVAKFDAMSIAKKKKVARMLGLPVTDGTSEEVVYNQVDTLLKSDQFVNGKHKGSSTIGMFNTFANMSDGLLTVRDTIDQSITHSIYRKKPNGAIYEGENEIATGLTELVTFLTNEDNQDELMALEAKLKAKKVALTS